MIVQSLIDDATLEIASRRSDLWHPSYLKWESYYLNNHGVGDGSRDVSLRILSLPADLR